MAIFHSSVGLVKGVQYHVPTTRKIGESCHIMPYSPYPFFLYLALCGSSRTFQAWELLNRLGLPRSHGKPVNISKHHIMAEEIRPLPALDCCILYQCPSTFINFQMIPNDCIGFNQHHSTTPSQQFTHFQKICFPSAK